MSCEFDCFGFDCFGFGFCVIVVAIALILCTTRRDLRVSFVSVNIIWFG
ncbi:hypothetical protein HMPREF1583_00174 [Gardnerella vaginalis JCP8151B]|nr:hypothetical protein HMPREF1583_00174 [Gardnerella vaginalis JCP8151B]